MILSAAQTLILWLRIARKHILICMVLGVCDMGKEPSTHLGEDSE